MSLPNSDSRALFEGNGAATQFPFSFRVWDESQLVVSLTSPQGKTSRATGWTAALTDNGGTVSYLHEGAPLPEGWKLSIVRNMPFVQEVELISGTRFDPEVIETALDQAAAERQQLLEQLSRAVIMPPTSEETPEEVVQSVYAARDAAADSATDAARNAAEAGQSALAAAHSEQEAAASAADAAASADLAQSLTEVGPATSERLGFVRIGQGISVDETGLISTEPVTLATPDAPGIVQVGAGLEIDAAGTLAAVQPSSSRADQAASYTSAGTNAATGFAIADGTDLAAIFGKLDTVSTASSGSGSYLTDATLSVDGKNAKLTISKGTPGYCSYCSYCSYCRYCTYCTYNNNN